MLLIYRDPTQERSGSITSPPGRLTLELLCGLRGKERVPNMVPKKGTKTKSLHCCHNLAHIKYRSRFIKQQQDPIE